ncbi:hypothetical protein [Ligilactobacillus saerimneri]|uniref:hypothetical protein n=1 Tax=Ligilactobacillus saerimneri TaxID=228229 RepID=UPI00242AC563|nr:hypothetical protein [Ligilactobacillus saerimneri]
MKFERLKALYDAEANVHYNGKLYEVKGVNEANQTALISEVGALFAEPREVKAGELD